MKSSVKITLIVLLTLAPVTAVVVYGIATRAPQASENTGPVAYKEIDWRLLRQLDEKTGEKTPELAELDGKPVKLPGFVVPLDDDTENASEFLLVPSPQACIHVPPPPANQMVMVRMKGKPPQRSWGPVWVMGRLFIATQESQYGKISFMMTGDSSEQYKMPEDG